MLPGNLSFTPGLAGQATTSSITIDNGKHKEEKKETIQDLQPANDPSLYLPPTYCICGEVMKQGVMSNGKPKCFNIKCPQIGKILTDQILYFCPNNSNFEIHYKMVFYCNKCGNELKTECAAYKCFSAPQYECSRCHHRFCAPHLRKTKNKNISSVICIGCAQKRRPALKVKGSSNFSGPLTPNKSKYIVIKEGFMSKKGNWLNLSFKKTYFKLYSNKEISESVNENGTSKRDIKLDENTILIKKSNKGFQLNINQKIYTFLCVTTEDRDKWCNCIQKLCDGNIFDADVNKNDESIVVPMPSAPVVSEQEIQVEGQ